MHTCCVAAVPHLLCRCMPAAPVQSCPGRPSSQVTRLHQRHPAHHHSLALGLGSRVKIYGACRPPWLDRSNNAAAHQSRAARPFRSHMLIHKAYTLHPDLHHWTRQRDVQLLQLDDWAMAVSILESPGRSHCRCHVSARPDSVKLCLGPEATLAAVAKGPLGYSQTAQAR